VSTYARAITWLTIYIKSYHIRFSISNNIHITIQVPSMLLRCRSSSQVLTIQKRWWFESIPNQLVIYSSHKPRFPRQGRLDHQWHFPSSHGITVMDRTTKGPPNCQDAPWAHSSRPCHTPFSTSLPIQIYPGSNSVTSFVVERYFIQLAKCETCVQHDKRDEQRSVLNRQRRNHYSPKPYKTPPGLHSSINTWVTFHEHNYS
jgi:hypothetical protein